VTAHHCLVADPERAAHGARGVAGVQVGTVAALEGLQVAAFAAGQIGSGGESFQVVRAQRLGPIGRRQRLAGVPPRIVRVVLAAPFEVGARIRHRRIIDPQARPRHGAPTGDPAREASALMTASHLPSTDR